MSTRQPTVSEMVRSAWPKHRDAAMQALSLFHSYCDSKASVPRVPGMDTALRLAVRIDRGATVEQAAAREYLYRWNLAIERSRAFGAPHAMGM